MEVLVNKQGLFVLAASFLLGACAYGDQRFVSDQSHEEMAANARAVERAERAERAEYRRERRQSMMDEADAINRANRGRRIYIIR